MHAAAKARRWHTCLALALVLGATGYLSRSAVVQLPVVDGAVPVRLLVAVAAVVVALTPMYPTFTSVLPTLARDNLLRRLRPGGAIVLALVAYLPAAVGVREAGPDTRVLLALLAVGLVAVVLVGELTWAVVLTLGLGVLVVDSAPGAPVTRLLVACTTAGLAVAVVLAAGVLAVRGPRAAPLTH